MSTLLPQPTIADAAAAPADPAAIGTPSPTSLGTRTARGFSWVLGQTVVGKATALLTQVLLGRLLLKDDFAVVSLAYVVTAFAAIVQDAGLSQVLVHRQRRFRLWSNPVAWMSVVSGLLAGSLVAACAPVAARVYAAPQLFYVLLILAVGTPLTTFAVVPTALLQSRMRFGVLSSVQVGSTLFTTAGTLTLAWLGWGPYSIVVPPIFTSLVRVPLMWWLARPTIRPTPQFRRWRYLLSDSSTVIASSFCITITMQADNLLLGLVATKESLATYYFGFGLAYQTTLLLTGSLAAVLFPALSSLRHDPVGQCRAFLQASRTLTFVGVPMCVLQAAAAAPALHLLFGDKWNAAIPIVQVLSIANALQLLTGPSVSLLQSQGRFATIFRITVSMAAYFVILVLIGAWLGGAIGVAWAAAISAGTSSQVVSTLAIRRGGGRWADVAKLYLSPIAIAAVTVAVALGVARVMPFAADARWVDALKIATIGVTFLAFYVAVTYWLAPGTVARFVTHLSRLRGPNITRSPQ